MSLMQSLRYLYCNPMKEIGLIYAMPWLKRLCSGILLLLFPVALVVALKQTAWGPIAATPQARLEGDAHAPLTIVEYSDFQCPSCNNIQPTIHTFMDTYKGKIRLAYKFFPLTSIHRNSMTAAHAAECAAEQNKFWPFHDQLFATQHDWENLTDPTTNFMAISAQVQLDPTAFDHCYTDPAAITVIQTDIAEGQKREVNATPTFFVGSERLVGGVFASDGARAIERELRK
jgi:protein-disulfide isomerase